MKYVPTEYIDSYPYKILIYNNYVRRHFTKRRPDIADSCGKTRFLFKFFFHCKQPSRAVDISVKMYARHFPGIRNLGENSAVEESCTQMMPPCTAAVVIEYFILSLCRTLRGFRPKTFVRVRRLKIMKF